MSWLTSTVFLIKGWNFKCCRFKSLHVVDPIISTKTTRAKLKEIRNKPDFFDIANKISLRNMAQEKGESQS